MQKIYLLGHTGYVGSWIHRYFSEKGYNVQSIWTDVTDLDQVRHSFHDIENAVVINATGKTGKPNVDWCEDHRFETASVNITGAINVCKVASEHGNYVLQIGSGCIFSTSQLGGQLDLFNGGECSDELKERIYAFTEEDEPNFFGSYYSQTKAVVEGALKEIPGVCILRIRMPLQGSSHPKNLLNKLLQYDRILSLPNSVTIMEDFMPFLERVLEKRPEGVLNSVNPGVYEHRDLLKLYKQYVDPQRSFDYLSVEEFQGMTKAERSNCVLSASLAESMGIVMPLVSESLPLLMQRYVASLGES